MDTSIMPSLQIINSSENIMELSGSGWPSNARFGSWPASGSLPFQLNAKLLGLLYAHAVTSTVWGYLISP